MIDWSNPKSKISDNFSVHEATYLPSWQTYHLPSEEEKTNILKTVSKMEEIRAYVNAPMKIHCLIRPTKVNNPGSDKHGQDYNAFVGGSPRSAHVLGLAVDFDVPGMSCDDVKAKLLIKLTDFGLRMEKGTIGWIHCDLMPPTPNRYFIP